MLDQEETQEPNYLIPENFDVAKAQLAKRRKIAEALIKTEAPGGIAGGNGGIYAMSGPLGGVGAALSRAAGAIDTGRYDDQEKLLAQQETGQNRKLLQKAGMDPDLAEAGSSIRPLLEKGMALKAAAEERGAQLAADREFKASEAELNRIERGEQQAQDRVSRQELRATPTIHISNSGGGGGGDQGPQGFGGAAPVIGADERGNPIYRHTKSGQLFQFDENGAPTSYQGRVGAKPTADRPLTENQGNAVLYGARAGEADKVMSKVGTDYSAIKTDMAHGATNIPGVSSLVNAGLAPKEQQVVQAQRDFVNAIMRRESGAAIATSEFSNARKQYFPQPGDSPEVLTQKAANRELVIKGLAEVSGPAGKKAIEAITPKGGAADDAAPARIGSDAEYNALSVGARYIAPDGSIRRRK